MDLAIPALFALFLWWFGTGIILFAVGLPRRTYIVTMATAALTAAASFCVVAATRDGTSPLDAYLAFTAALAIWGFAETAFLTGYVTGPRKTPCPASAHGWQRARYATSAIIHHELMLAAAGLAIAALTFGGANPVAAATFALLWIMRLSAKLNLFLGVRVRNAELLPDHLKHLQSYFGDRPINPLLPVSVVLSVIGTIVLAMLALDPSSAPFARTSYSLLAALLALAALEHIVMAVPLPVAELWRWSLKNRRIAPGSEATETQPISAAPSWPARPAIAKPVPVTGRGA